MILGPEGRKPVRKISGPPLILGLEKTDNFPHHKLLNPLYLPLVALMGPRLWFKLPGPRTQNVCFISGGINIDNAAPGDQHIDSFVPWATKH